MTIFCGDSRDGVFVYLMAAVMGALYYLKHSSERNIQFGYAQENLTAYYYTV